jgi:hypothetical protein
MGLHEPSKEAAVLFLGVDWGERHHDLCLLDQDGAVLAARRVAVGIETDRGCWSGRWWPLATRCMRSTRRW